MTNRLKIALAQMNQRVGDLEGNARAMLEMRRKAKDADLLVCPELQVVGYPPEDLVLKPEFVRRVHECTDELIEATAEPGPAMLIGTIVNEGGQIFNAMILADGGKVLGRTFKHGDERHAPVGRAIDTNRGATQRGWRDRHDQRLWWTPWKRRCGSARRPRAEARPIPMSGA